MGGVGVIERLAKNILRVLGRMRADGRRQVGVDRVRHGGIPGTSLNKALISWPQAMMSGVT